MTNYRLLMHGQNFLLNKNGKTARYGFYHNVFTEAENLKQAQLMVTSKIWHDKELKEMTLNSKKNPPKISLATYWELDNLDYAGKHLSTDRTFYPEKKWWQFWK
ncbi:MAG: hypothetical protein KAS94_11230 [Desulfobulbaceae bacterium]|nr:hypothetical protein [Desulfobulbaceae bacterium]